MDANHGEESLQICYDLFCLYKCICNKRVLMVFYGTQYPPKLKKDTCM